MTYKYCSKCNTQTIETMKICPNCGFKDFTSSPTINHVAAIGNTNINIKKIETRKQKGWRFFKSTFGFFMLIMIVRLVFVPLDTVKILEILISMIFGGLFCAAVAFAIGYALPQK